MELWTLDELAERVEAALADYPGQVNGRVRAVPDQRAIRWYTTTGLVDRPTEMRGRTAMYDRRHLLQLVAIKRRQAQGHTLAQIQAELAGATNETLHPIAALTDPLPSESGPASPSRARFWADRPADTPPPPDPSSPTGVAAPKPTPPSLVAEQTAPSRAAEQTPSVGVVAAVRIGEGVTVVLEQGGVVVDAERLAAAAGPFLAELRRQGLLSRSSGDET